VLLSPALFTLKITNVNTALQSAIKIAKTDAEIDGANRPYLF
jgi:hypothetical protein